tara:strand:- start:697 stop:2589 length:1893 start_codon:yes stop_codon:yes gene_type:complete
MSDINSNNAYEHPNQNPENFERWKPENIQEYKEAVYDKISALLIEKLSQIDDGGGIQSLQKTYKDGLLVTGKSSSDVMVVYESDVEANADDKSMDDAILNWLDFASPEQLTLTIEPTLSVGDGGEDQVGALPPPDFILHLPDRDLNINKILGTFNIDDVNLKDNVSQFMGFSKSPPNISRLKLSEYVDTEISELLPVTFTQFLEEYNKAKKRIPFYRHRTDDFFNEYGNSIIPIEYRIEKFFEEFARIKDQIPAGSLAGVSSTDARTEGGLFGYRTMTYLLKEARVAMDDGEIPEWSVNQVISFMDEIDNLALESGSLVDDRDYWRDLYEGVESTIPALSESEIFHMTQSVIPSGWVDLPTHISEAGYGEVTGDDTLDLEDVRHSILSGIPVHGCTDEDSKNYNPDANVNDGSCVPFVYGCTDPAATNQNILAEKDNDSCIYVQGCTNPNADNYHPDAVKEDPSNPCIFGIKGCTYVHSDNYDADATVDDGSCIFIATEYIGVTDRVIGDISDVSDKPPSYWDSMEGDNVPFKDEVYYSREESSGTTPEEESSELPPVFGDEGEFDRYSKGGRTRPSPRKMARGRKTRKMPAGGRTCGMSGQPPCPGGGYRKGRRMIQAPKGRKATRRRR